MTCPTHRAGLRVTDTARTDIPEPPALTHADAHRATCAAIEAVGSVQVGFRTVELQHRAWISDGHVTVFDQDEPDTSDGTHYRLTLTPLTRCDSHDRYYPTRDRLCDLCVIEQTNGDE